MNFIRTVGAKTLDFIQSLGSITLFLLRILTKSATAFTRPRLSIRQVYFSGVMSVLIIAVSGLFVGMVLGLQGYTQLAKFKSADILGYMVAASLLRELGPVLAAILFASSAGGAMTSEIGLMKTTEQLEAMNVMAVDPVARVVAPRFWAGVFSMPLLASIFNVAGIYGAYLVGVQWLGLDGGIFWAQMQNNISFGYDVANGLIKSAAFGTAVTLFPLRADFRRNFTRQYAHGGFFRPDDSGGRFCFNSMDVYRVSAMKKSILEFWVGLFVLLGAVAVGFLAFRVAGGTAISGSSGKSYTVYAEFSDIGGLKTNAPVKSAGVLVGRVASISLDPKTYQAKVSLNLNSQYKFSSDVSAQILTSGLLGEQYIGLQQGGDTEDLAAGDTISVTSSAMVLENLIGKFMTNFAEKNAGDSKKAADSAAE